MGTKNVISAQAELCFINIHDYVMVVKAVHDVQSWLFDMSVPHRKAIAVLMLSSLFLDLSLLELRTGLSSDQKSSLDVFKQKTPFSGLGLNVPSDAFGPQELVALYALVTYDTIPVQGSPVLFQVTLPNSTYFTLTAQSNSTGIASVDFTIMTSPANTGSNGVFGDWKVQANAMVNSVVVSDTLVFRVDWIVKLLSLRTVDDSLTYRSSFGIGGDVGFELSLRNIAMTVKDATITLTLRDELNTTFSGSSQTVDLEAQPNETSEYIYLKFQIPRFASIGEATAQANALTALANQDGVPYCPNITVNFSITTGDQRAIAFHDVSLTSITSSARSLRAGQPLALTLEARNEGTELEAFNVTAYFGDVAVNTELVTDLSPYSAIVLNFTVDTSSFAPGTYTPMGLIPNLPAEADLTDNTVQGGTVDIIPQAPVYSHDVGITSVNTSSSTAHVSELVQVNVTVTNKGNATESFNVSVYYDLVLIATLDVADLRSSNNQTLNFRWDTTSLNKTTYQISAVAPLANDIDPSDNTIVDGTITLVEPLASYFVLDWFDGFLIFGILLFAAVIAALLLFRRLKKRDEPRTS